MSNIKHKAGAGSKIVARASAGAGADFPVQMKSVYKIRAYRPVPIDEFEKLFGAKLSGIGASVLLADDFGKVEKAIESGMVPVSVAEKLVPNHDFTDYLKWEDGFENIVVNAGLDDLLDKYFKGSAYTSAHYVGLTDGTPTVAGADTMASHAGWTEVTAYDEATREALTLGTVSGQSVDNSASKATFTISANGTTIGGAFVTTVNTKGGSTGTLYGGGAFSAGDKLLDDNDTLNVTVTLTTSAT